MNSYQKTNKKKRRAEARETKQSIIYTYRKRERDKTIELKRKNKLFN